MEQRLTLITLGVTNLQRSKAFYQNVFGWQPTALSTEAVVFFQLNGLQLALFPQESLADDAGVPADGKGFRRFSLAYNVQSEQEVDELVASLEAKGAKVLKQPEKVFWGGYSSYIADPDENLWEIAYNPFIPLEKDEVGASIH
ncbi:VOC family protein [Pontibacter diazotrophicus]|uniref:VOC family protein n=1 Tax=Pontibacter diazotrophicus TaxID=1400979 RepID=A0A3D8L9G6_9BACT|nr:VOC family protein [Pontibacter diazotrophicus]RDV13994.1 VOC family protein [Pontibacter diazotrophicus]